MKKRNVVITLAALLSVLVVPLAFNRDAENKNDANTPVNNLVAQVGVENATEVASENTQKVINAIAVLENVRIDASYQEYIQTIWYAYHTLSAEEKEQVGEYYDMLLAATETLNKAMAANEFEKDFNYLLNDSTFAYKDALNNFKTQYDAFDEVTKSYITSYTEENIAKVEENGKALTPDIYYDFTNATVNSSNFIVNQGSLVGKDAELKGSASVANGYLQFGNSSTTDQSCLKLPSDMFSGATDFTFSVVYEKTSTDYNESIFTVGNSAYHAGSGTTKAGIRAQYSGWSEAVKRAPFYMLAIASTEYSADQYFGASATLTPVDDTLHTYKITVRYLSKAQVLQIYQQDLTTEKNHYINYKLNGKEVPLNSSNFDFTQFNENYLGAKDGKSNGNESFQGKYLSFRYYSKLVTDREMYGSDDRNLYIGEQEALNYINNFEKVGASFEQYKDIYAPVIDKYYKVLVSCPYDFQKFFDPEHVEYFMEAYNIIHAE